VHDAPRLKLRQLGVILVAPNATGTDVLVVDDHIAHRAKQAPARSQKPPYSTVPGNAAPCSRRWKNVGLQAAQT